MERAVFDRLLFEEESATLDFKSTQYHFNSATDAEKSELLKDILGFANAWRRSDAYILIGVEEVRGGPHKVVGIAANDHLDDHSLQQFVHNLTNRNLLFSYEAFTFDEKHIGIIRIEQQPRPFYLKRNYGKLKKEQVYVRRGSSTDWSQPACLDEIARMGRTPGPSSAELAVEFADSGRDETLDDRLTWNAEFLETPPPDQIPDVEPPRSGVSGISLPWPLINPLNRLNPNYLRELAQFEFVRRLFRPVQLVVLNVGDVGAKNVRCELAIPANIGVLVIDASDWPDAPERRSSALYSAAIKGIKPLSRTPGDVTIDKNDERCLIEIECGDLQPGRRVLSDVFYVGKRESGELELAGHLYADNLPQPKELMLTISVKVSRMALTVNELRALPEQPA